MKRLIPIILILSFFLSSCGALGSTASAETTPTINSADVKLTAEAMVYLMLTETAAAMPTNTNTPVPPTETPLPEPTATPTLIPTLVEDTSTSPEATTTAEIIPTSTTASTSSTFPCTEKPLTDWTGESVLVTVTNNIPNSTANVFLCITTPYGEAGYINVPVVTASSAYVPRGLYSATAWVDGTKDFNSSIGFEIKSFATSFQLVIENNQLYFKASCAPNC